MFKDRFSVLRSAAFAVGTLAVAQMASAQTTLTVFDTAGANTAILGMVAGLVLIGGAVFALTLGIKSTKWARKAL